MDPATKAILDKLEASLTNFHGQNAALPPPPPIAERINSELVRDRTGFLVRKDMLQPAQTPRVQNYAPPSSLSTVIDAFNMVPNIPDEKFPRTMIQVLTIQAIEQYNKAGDYSAAYLARAIGISLLGRKEFIRALEVAEVRMAGKWDKDAAQSHSFTALRDMILIWENVVGTGDEKSISWVKGIIERIHGEGVLAEEEKKWKDGVKVGIKEDV